MKELRAPLPKLSSAEPNQHLNQTGQLLTHPILVQSSRNTRNIYQLPIKVGGKNRHYKCGRPYQIWQLMTTVTLYLWVLPKEQHQERA